MNTTPDDVVAATEALLLASRALVGVAARSLAGIDDVTLSQYRALVVLTTNHWDTIRANSILQQQTTSQVVSDPKSGAKSTVATPGERKNTFDLYAGYNYLDGGAEGDATTFATRASGTR